MTCGLTTASTVGCGSSDSTPKPGAAATGGAGGSSGDGVDGSGAAAPNGGASDGGTGEGAAPDSEPPADVAGEYVVSLTNGANDCSTVDWVAGMTTTGVMFTIRQDGTKLTAETGGDAAVIFVLLTGSNKFTGDIHGNAFTLTDHGPTVAQSGNCMYTVDAVVEGTIDGDAIAGTLTYHPVISDDPDCAQYACAAVEDFTGERPPGG